MDALDIEKWRFVSDRYVLCSSQSLFSHNGKTIHVQDSDFFCRPGTSVIVSSVLLALVLIGRAAFVFPLSFLSNLTKKSQSEKISFRQQVKMTRFLSINITFLDCQVIITSSPFFVFLGDHLVGWSYERCCFNGTCL